MRRKNEPIDVWLHIAIPSDGDPAPCWPWTGKLNPTDGRPYFTVGGVRWLAYRLVYTLVHGPIADGNVVRHRDCNNEACCNPHHLLEGTQGDNERDKGDTDRWGFPREILDAVLEYKRLGMPQAAIASVCTAQYGVLVTQQRVSDILTGARRAQQTGVGNASTETD